MPPAEDASPWDVYMQRPMYVEARRVEDHPEKVQISKQRTITVHPGDWVVRFRDGTIKAYKQEQFHKLFHFAQSGPLPSPRDNEHDAGPPGVSF